MMRKMLLLIQDPGVVKRVQEGLTEEALGEAEVISSWTPAAQEKTRDILSTSVVDEQHPDFRNIHNSLTNDKVAYMVLTTVTAPDKKLKSNNDVSYVFRGTSARELGPKLSRLDCARRRQSQGVVSTSAVSIDSVMSAPFIGRSEFAKLVAEKCRRAASSRLHVLVRGEPGTGKNLIIHRIAYLASELPLVTLDCGALSPDVAYAWLFGSKRGTFTGAEDKDGLVLQAKNGQLFLDEIGNMPLDTQAKLLSYLSEFECLPLGAARSFRVELRILAATNMPLEEMVRVGKFRRDLLPRLRQFVIHIPPLRERPEDILPIAKYFLDKLSSKKKLSKDAESLIESYNWPDNVRELESVLAAACLDGGATIEKAAIQEILQSSVACTSGHCLPLPGTSSATFPTESENEKNYFKMLMDRTRGNVPEAAKLADMPVRTLYARLKKLGIAPGDYGNDGSGLASAC